MNDDYFKRIMSIVFVIALIVLAFFLLKPILLPIVIALLLAFIFSPVYNWFLKRTDSKNISASIVCVILALIIILPLWFLTPIAINQSLKFFTASQQVDFIGPLKTIFPNFFASETFSSEVGSILHSFVSKVTNSLVNGLSDLILNFPTLFLQALVVFFTFFFVLRDREIFISYIKTLLPFTKDIETRLFKSSKDIVFSVPFNTKSAISP